MTETGTIATIKPYGLKTKHPGIVGLIKLDGDGRFIVWHSSQLAIFPLGLGPRLRIGAPCTVEPVGPYGMNIQLTTPIPFP